MGVRGPEVFDLPESRRVTQARARYAAVFATTFVLWAITAVFVAIGIISSTQDPDGGLTHSRSPILAWFAAGLLCFVASVAVAIRILSQRSSRFLPVAYLGVLCLAVGITQIALHGQ